MDQLSEGLRKLVLAGIGAVAATKEKSEGILDELVKKGELTVEQGKVLNEELKHNIKDAIRENVTVNVVTDDMLDAVDDMDDEQLAALKERIAKTEAARSQEQPAEEAPEAPVESETAAETETEETK